MKTIVVGYDDTEPAKRALERGAELATAFDARVIVTSVASGIHGRGLGPVDPSIHPSCTGRSSGAPTPSSLSATSTVSSISRWATPPTTSPSWRQREGADLVVVGTRGVHLVERMLGLSVSGKVGRKSQCDVLVVR